MAMLWLHTKTLVVSNKHSKIKNRKTFIFAQDNFLRPDAASFLQKPKNKPLIEMRKI